MSVSDPLNLRGLTSEAINLPHRRPSTSTDTETLATTCEACSARNAEKVGSPANPR